MPLIWYAWEGTRPKNDYSSSRENTSGRMQSPDAISAVQRLQQRALPVTVTYIAECSPPVDIWSMLAWLGKYSVLSLLSASAIWTVITLPLLACILSGAMTGTGCVTYYMVNVSRARESAALAVAAAEQAKERTAKALQAAAADADRQLAAADPEFLASLRSSTT